ncbi:hypothetical protein TNCV_1772871 [Trichonephila clavipes]|nr:hypothetical protein TNCV_1772871 [Trichonephila clavipes]
MKTPPVYRPGLKNFDFDLSLEREQKPSVEETRRHFSKTSFRLCRGWNHRQIFRQCRGWNHRQIFRLCRGWNHRQLFRLCRGWNHSHKHLRRGANSNNFNYITCEEVKSVESKFFFNYWIHRTCEQQGS